MYIAFHYPSIPVAITVFLYFLLRSSGSTLPSQCNWSCCYRKAKFLKCCNFLYPVQTHSFCWSPPLPSWDSPSLLGWHCFVFLSSALAIQPTEWKFAFLPIRSILKFSFVRIANASTLPKREVSTLWQAENLSFWRSFYSSYRIYNS